MVPLFSFHFVCVFVFVFVDAPSVRPSVPRYFRKTNMADFEEKKSSNDIKNIGTISVDEVVASYVPPRYFLLLLLLLLFLWALFLWQLLLLALWQLWKT